MGAPVAGNNVTFTANAYALQVDSGESLFTGNVWINGSPGHGIVFTDGTRQLTNAASYGYSVASYATANSAQANTIVTQGVDAGQNAAISIIQGVDNTQNTWISSNVAYFQGIENTQNTWISSNVAYIAGVDAGQNTTITAVNNFAQGAYNQANGANGLAQGAFIKANTPWGYLANSSYTAILNTSGQFVLPSITTGGYVGGSMVAAGAFVMNANGNLWAFDTYGQLVSPYSVKLTTTGVAFSDGT